VQTQVSSGRIEIEAFASPSFQKFIGPSFAVDWLRMAELLPVVLPGMGDTIVLNNPPRGLHRYALVVTKA
jgi:hypothetical protein